MTHLLLDTNIVVLAMKRREPAIDHNVGLAIGRNMLLAVSVLTLYELQVGVMRNANPVSAGQRLHTFLKLVSVIWEFDEEDALVAAQIRATLMRTGNAIGSLDTLIAAQAIRRNVPVVTNNVSEFSRVPNLRSEDWTQA